MKPARLLAGLALVLSACSGGPPESAPPTVGGAAEPPPPPVTAPAPAPEAKAPGAATARPAVSAASTDWAKRMDAVVKDQAVGQQERAALSQQYYRLALEHYQGLEFDKAEDNVRKALDAKPDFPEAKDLADRIAVARGQGRPGDQGGQYRDLINQVVVRVQQSQVEIDAHLDKAARLLAEAEELASPKAPEVPADVDSSLKRLDQAEATLRRVLEMIKWFPYQADLEARQKQAEQLIEKVKLVRRDEEVRVDEERRRRAREETTRQEQVRKEELSRRLDTLFDLAQREFEKEHYQECIELCDKVTYLNPNLTAAFELQRIARRANHAKDESWNREVYVEEWKRTFEKIDRKAVLQGRIVEFSDRDAWDRIKKRERKGITQLDEPLSPEEEKILASLQQIKVTLEFQEQPLREVVEFLRQFTNLNFVFEADVDQAAVVTLKVQNLPLQSALNLILGGRELAYSLEDGVIKIVPKAKLLAKIKLELYDVQDLTAQIRDFPGPNISLIPDGGAAIQAEEAGKEIIPSQALIDLIKANIAKETWDSPGMSLDYNNGLLIVRNTPAVHKQVQQFLNDVRSSTGLLVTVETRFLRVQDNFLEEIGVDFRDLDLATAPLMSDVNYPIRGIASTGQIPFGPQQGGLGLPPIPSGFMPAASIDDRLITNAPLAALGPIAVGDDVTTGMIYRGGNAVARTMQARAEHILEQDTLVTRFYSTVFTNSGGMSMQYTLLDDISLEAILRAVKKKERSVDLTAPKLTLFNTQRAHIILSNQLAYVRDYDIELATAVAIPDPQVDLVQDGVVLDVRPIVSADRRFITLELRPTVARLIPSPSLASPMTPNVTTPVGPVSVTIETPVLRIERVRTTVTMPDRGTILLGGFTDYVEEDTISEIPILSQIPFLSLLTSRKMKGRKRYQLLILTRATITMMEEEEEARFR
jgi:type II secretory pathway component GspD/PulD (secretin)/tetratricopeptide (TPR) repeat protein